MGERISTSVLTGADVQLPIADLMARVPAEELRVLVPHLATEAGGYSQTSAAEYLQSGAAQELQAEVQRVMAEKQADDAWRASADAVRADVLAQLEATGRFRPEVNNAYADMVGSFYSVIASRTGQTPQELAAAYPLTIQAKGMPGEVGYGQTAQWDTPEFRNWFGDSKVVDAEGKPLVVYHGTTADVNAFDLAYSGSDGVGYSVPAIFATTDKSLASDYSVNKFNRNIADAMRAMQKFKNEHPGEYGDEYEKHYQAVKNAFKTVENGRETGIGANVIPLHMSLRNPLVVEANGKRFMEVMPDSIAKAHADGHDGLIVRGVIDHASPASEHPADVYIAFHPEQIKSAIGNRGTFNPNDPNILHQNKLGTFNPETLAVTLLAGANLSTFLHESGHFFLEVMADLAARPDAPAQVRQDVEALMRWFGVRDLAEWHSLDVEGKRPYHEQFARGFEAYLFEGKAPSPEAAGLFQRFSEWLKIIYQKLAALKVELTPEVRSVFDRMLATDEQIQLAEQARSMMPLFESAEQGGMSPEAWAAYQAANQDATAEAQSDLQARALRDMQWLKRFRDKVLKAIQKDAKALRADAEMEARREVMSRPVYRAWQFLTAKVGEEDMTAAQLAAEQYGKALREWKAERDAVGAKARKEAIQAEWLASPEGQRKYRKTDRAQAARAKFERDHAADWDKVAADAIAEWDKSHPEPTKPTSDMPAKSSPRHVDPTQDSMFAAIAKLGGIDRAQLISEWGMDKKEKARAETGFGGKTQVDREGGMRLDEMGMHLAELGYLNTDEDGHYDAREFEEKFFDGLGGHDHYSMQFDYRLMQERKPGEEFANPAAVTAGRLDRGSLTGAGLPAEAVAKIEKARMVAAQGLHPDIVADIIGGFSSGDEMLRELAVADTPAQAIEAATDKLMLERHGELSSPEAIERAADRAVVNEARARFVATEANALEKALGQKQTLARAAKQFAEITVARLRIRNVRPGQYGNAETRAAKAAKAAMAANDLATAAAEKRNQLVALYATRAAHDAREEIDKGVKYLRKFEGNVKGLDAGYRDQITALLERFDLAPRTLDGTDRLMGLASWLRGQAADGIVPDVSLLAPLLGRKLLQQYQNALRQRSDRGELIYSDENGSAQALLIEYLDRAERKPYKEMTVEEFRGVMDTVRQLEHLGRMKDRLLTAKDQAEYAAVRDEIATSIRENAKGRQATARSAATAGEDIKRMARLFGAAHVKVATWARILDGGRDGGPVWEYFVRGANERGDFETRMMADATAELSRILAPVTSGDPMRKAPRLFSSIDRSLTREQVLAIALNWGNDGNRQRLLDGEGWTEAQVLPILKSLTAEEWRAVQGVWSYLDTFRPLIGAKERRVYGREPEWIEPAAFSVNTADGQTLHLTGGYYPVKYDPLASQRAEEHADAEGAKRQMQGAYQSSTTRRSFTKQRADAVVGRPLLLSLAGIYSGVTDVIHDLAWHEWLIDTNRLLRSQTIDAAIRQHYGPEVKEQLKSWVRDIAEGGRGAQGAGEMMISRLRQGVSAAGLGFNVMSALMQPLGITQSVVRVGAGWVGRGVAHYLASPIAATREATAKSKFMMDRARTQFREINELRNKVGGQSKVGEFFGRYAYFMMMRVQQTVDVPTWHGAYAKALAEGNDEERAIALADQAVIDSQGSGHIKDLSGIERGGPGVKLFTSFYGFMNTAANVGYAQAKTAKSRGKLAADMLLLYTVPALLGTLIKQALTPGGGGDDDPEKLAKKLASEQLSYLMGLMVGLRELGFLADIVTGANAPRGYSGPVGTRLLADLEKFAVQASQGEFDTAFRKAAVNLLGDATGLPAAQVNRTWTGAEALASGETSNPAALAFGFHKQK